MKPSIRSVVVLLGVAGVLAASPARADDDPAIKKAQAYSDALLAEMKTAKATPVKKRYDQLEPAIKAFFDLPAMTKTAVGPSWATLDPKDQEIITDAFSRFTIATYANRFDAILKDGGPAALVEKLKSQADRQLNPS